MTCAETQRIKCFFPHKLGQISSLLPDHVFFLVFPFLPSAGRIKGDPLKHLFPIDEITFGKFVVERSSLGSTGLLAILGKV